MRFRKRPVEVDAIQLTQEEFIETLEGKMRGNPGDWKITGVNGERYPCAKDIFAKTYEPADAEAMQAWVTAYGTTYQR